MSQQERDRLKVIEAVLTGKMMQIEASRLLGLTVRQVRRIQRRMQVEGDGGVVHRLRGKVSNARKDPFLRKQVLQIYSKHYAGFGPTMAAEKLVERGLAVSAETLRQWLIPAKLWKPKRRRLKHRQRRDRRECFGELVQTDGSIHDWLEGRGPKMTLLVLIDDATSKVVARFYPAETTDGYFKLLKRYIRKHGRMIAIYADRHSIFYAKNKRGYLVTTQFGRGLEELGIRLIHAHSPQAKGRVERFNGTAQDRLVKELRLAKAQTMAQANKIVAEVFLPWFNRNCTVKPASNNDAHRPIGQSLNLNAILCSQETRTVANDYTIRFKGSVIQLMPPARAGLRGGKVIIEQRTDKSMHIRFKKKYLKFEFCRCANNLGALPPNPRSLPPSQIPAHPKENTGSAATATKPSAVHPTAGRSGRTPAEPYPSNGNKESTTTKPKRPGPNHPWRQYKTKRKA